MAKNSLPLPSKEVLQKLLRYEKATGKLYWKTRPMEFFADSGHSAAHSCAKWNSRWAGKEALVKMNVGYRCGRLLYQAVLAHRVIWKMMTGEDPVEVDHINGNRSDNRWSNLRAVTESVNRKNVARRMDNTSGAVGVQWRAASEKWIASIQIGSYDTFEEAVAARKAAELKLGFHPNNGREAAPEGLH